MDVIKEQKAPAEISKKTLADMDRALKNLTADKVSEAIDLSDFNGGKDKNNFDSPVRK